MKSEIRNGKRSGMEMIGEPWFDRAERIAGLRREALLWVGTPFMCNSDTPGPHGGVSCQKLASAIYSRVGWRDIEVPEVAMAHARFSRVSLVERYMESRPEFGPVLDGHVRPGDLLGFRLAGTVHHVGIVLDRGEFVHVMDHLGCVISALSDPTYASRLAAAWRPLELIAARIEHVVD